MDFSSSTQADHERTACQIISAELLRYYWAKFDRVVGASRGQETAYLLVEHDASTGDVHGHPVTRDELIGKGVSL